MSEDMSRRRLLQAAGGIGIITMSGCTSDQSNGLQNGTDNSSSDSDKDNESDVTNGAPADDSDTDEHERERPEHGSVVFVYDDGPIEDYTQALPAHKEFDAPATVGIVSEWVDRSDDWMDTYHLDELVDHGWEICSHTTQHATVATAELIEKVSADDTTLSVDHYRHGNSDLDIELVSADTDDILTREVTGFKSGDPNQITLGSSVGQTLPAGSIVRYSSEDMHELLGDSKAALEAMGYEVSTLLAPYDQFDEYSMKFVPEYYDGVANANHGSFFNDPEKFDPYETRRGYFIEFTDPDTVRADLDEIAAKGLLGVVGAHTFKDKVTKEGIYDMLSWVNKREIEVLTLRDAIDIYAP